jgi:hypothetical protein
MVFLAQGLEKESELQSKVDIKGIETGKCQCGRAQVGP